MAALGTRAPMAAERRGAALGDRLQDLPLRGAEPGELARVRLHDVGEFQAAGPERVRAHADPYGVGGNRLARSGRRSSGLGVSCR
jgi:hypothetical protein